MRLHRFYVTEKIGTKSQLVIDSPSLVNQIHKVFRLKTGDNVIVFDGSGSDFECKIDKINKKEISLLVISATRSRYIPGRNINLYASIVKKDNFEWIVEKATELGVSSITPVLAERSEKKAINMERLNKIATEASEQSGRGDIPKINEMLEFDKAIVSAKNNLIFHTEGNKIDHNVEKLIHSHDVDVFIGPEGGWSQKEIEVFHTMKFPIISIGDQILRAETAVIAALSKVLL